MKSVTLTDNIYESLKKEIIESRVKPGEKLSEMKLAKQFEVSRAPIRDVIARLKQDGLVVVKPQIGTIVSPISLTRASEVLEVRLLLEPYAAKVAAKNITDEEIEMLKYIFKQIDLKKQKKGADILLDFQKDESLHKTIWELCGNEVMKNILEIYRYEIYRIRIIYPHLAVRLVPADDIKEISSALFNKKPDRAFSAMYNHIAFVKETITEFLRNQHKHR